MLAVWHVVSCPVDSPCVSVSPIFGMLCTNWIGSRLAGVSGEYTFFKSKFRRTKRHANFELCPEFYVMQKVVFELFRLRFGSGFGYYFLTNFLPFQATRATFQC